jgi:hypothetical protein
VLAGRISYRRDFQADDLDILPHLLPGVQMKTRKCRIEWQYRLCDVFQLRGFDRQTVFQQIINAVNQLHASGFMHCDI